MYAGPAYIRVRHIRQTVTFDALSDCIANGDLCYYENNTVFQTQCSALQSDSLERWFDTIDLAFMNYSVYVLHIHSPFSSM